MIISGCAGIQPPPGVAPVEKALVVSGYCRCGKCCGWERNWFGRPIFTSGPKKGQVKQVGVTSSGAHARYGTIAADISKYPYGTVMYVEGYGYGRVEDTGGEIKGDRIDLYFGSHRRAEAWGRKTMRVKVWLVAPPGSGKPAAPSAQGAKQ